MPKILRFLERYEVIIPLLLFVLFLAASLPGVNWGLPALWNPDELVWSHMKRTGVARAPLRQGETLRDKIERQLAAIKRMPQLVRSFFQAPTVAYISDW